MDPEERKRPHARAVGFLLAFAKYFLDDVEVFLHVKCDVNFEDVIVVI